MPWSGTKLRRRRKRLAREAARRRVFDEADAEFERTLFTPAEPPPDLLWHFTDWSGFEGILKTKCIWCTHYSCTNDKSEIVHAHSVLLPAALEVVKTRQSEAVARFLYRYDRLSLTELADLYVSSFSEVEHDAGQWLNYGRSGTGVALGLRLRGVNEVAPLSKAIGISIHKLDYDVASARAAFEADIVNALEIAERCARAHPTLERQFKMMTTKWLLRDAGGYCAYLKEPSWSREREWRLIYMIMKNPDAPHLKVLRRRSTYCEDTAYVAYPLCRDGEPLPLVEVVLGPKAAQSDADAAELVRSRGLSPGIVRRSSVPLR